MGLLTSLRRMFRPHEITPTMPDTSEQHLRSHTGGELETFQAAIHEYIEPLAAKCELSLVQIDQELYALVAPGFYIKFYCAGGHGYNFTVTIGPTFEPKWNTQDERGLPWLVQYVGKHSWTHDRYGSRRSYSEAIAHLAALLPSYIDFLKKASPSFWPEFYEFTRVQIAKASVQQTLKT